MSSSSRDHARSTGVALEWQSIVERPPPFSRIIMLYDDGSGANLYYVTEDGELIDGEDGCTYEWAERDNMGLWAHLPSGFRFWVENCSEPMTLPSSAKPAPGDRSRDEP